MDLKSFVDRATEAANKAAQKAQEAATAISAATGTPAAAAAAPAETALSVEAEDHAEGTELALAESALPTAATLNAPAPVAPKSFGALANEKLNELSAVGSQKIQELVTAFQQSLPAIRSAGYELTEFEVELGVTPKLIPHFRHAPKSIEDIDAARERTVAVLGATRKIRSNIQTPALANAVEAFEPARFCQIRDPDVLPWCGPPIGLLPPLDLALDVETPDRLPRFEPQRLERNRDFRDPSVV